MTDSFSEDDVIATVSRLTRVELVSFIKAEFVRPERQGDRYIFRRVDIARLELLCDLTHDLEMDETALGVVVTLLDQLHAARHERAVMARAITTLPDDLQARILAALTTP